MMTRLIVLNLLTLFTVGYLYAQPTINGVVTDGTKPLSFCSVYILGTTNGTHTDLDGKFTLSHVSAEDTLVASYIGYTDYYTVVGEFTDFEIHLSIDKQNLDEVVVIGFGTQKKVNLTGAVVAVNGEKLKNRGVSNVTNMLSGQTPGLTVLQRGGSPGRNEGQLRIRGIGTLASVGNTKKNDPLIIVDGIETGSLTEISPQDIKSISILKDASASAIYGVRAANGVILITTKRGAEGETIVNYSYQYGVSQATGLPEKVNAETLAELYTEAQRNAGLSTRLFRNEDIELFQSGASPFTHANVNHLDEIISQSGMRQAHNLSFAGGNQSLLYNMSLGYTDENGLMTNTGLKRYNFRTNLDIILSDKLTTGMNISGSQRRITDPIVGVGGIIHRAYREWATDPIRLENNDWAIPNFGNNQGIDHNGVALLDDGGKKEFVDSRFTGSFFAEYKPWDFLSFKGIAATVQDMNRSKQLTKPLTLYNLDGSQASISQSQVFEGRDNISDVNLQLLTNIVQHFGHNEVKALLGFNYREVESIFGAFSALDLRDGTLDQINSADLTQDQVSGFTTDYRLLSYFGRVNYSFKDRYLLEGNLRYDGTSRFSKNNRFGVFPSFAIGWRVSEESFFNWSFIDELKVRASWGRLGNQEIGDYRFINSYVFDQTAYINDQEQGGSTEKIPLGNADILWETTQVFNYGLDISLLSGALSLSADYFIRKTSDVLIQKPLTAVFGSGTKPEKFPFVNAASTQNKGFELNLDYRLAFNSIKISTNLNFSQVDTEITDLAGTDQPGFSVGDPIANIYGYAALGIFQNQDEINNHADQSSLGSTTRPGDIKYQDFTGPNGTPDGIVNALDRRNLGSFFPGINYGFSLKVEYKGFDFSSLWQGVADVNSEIGGRQRQPFFFGSSPWNLHLDRAIVDREGVVSNPEARYPRTLLTGFTKNYITSDWWVESTAFLKLRNAQIGYNFPQAILDKLKISRLRLYITGENLLVFTNFDGFDPEIPTSGSVLPFFSGNAGYPVTKSYVFGANLTF